jgi:hypothetical protein
VDHRRAVFVRLRPSAARPEDAADAAGIGGVAACGIHHVPACIIAHQKVRLASALASVMRIDSIIASAGDMNGGMAWSFPAKDRP